MSKSRKGRISRARRTNRRGVNVHKVAIRNHEANRLLGKSKHRWNDNVKVRVKVSP